MNAIKRPSLPLLYQSECSCPQTIPIKTYAVITIVTLGVGVVYWLYKVVNLYNAHFKAHLQVKKELGRL